MTTISLADADTMFRDCIVEYEGDLVVVRDVLEKDDGIKLAVRKLGARGNILIDPDPDMVYCPTAPYRLGYVQYDDSAAFLNRTPRRQYKVGWCQNNVSGLSIEHVMRTGASIGENLKGIFMSFEEAIRKSVEVGGIYAFDRCFAVADKGRVLYYKGQGIANIAKNDANLEEYNYGHIREWFNKAKEKK